MVDYCIVVGSAGSMGKVKESRSNYRDNAAISYSILLLVLLPYYRDSTL